MESSVLTLMVFLPLLGALIVVAIPRTGELAMRVVSLVATGIPVLLAIWLYKAFDPNVSGMQFTVETPWIPPFNIWYRMGVDGLSISLVLLTALLSFICIIASWNITGSVKGYHALFLLLETGMQGVFVSLDFFLFYVFWEMMLLPMYFLIGIWGGPNRVYAAIKFFLYTLAGSVLMLLAMLAFYFTTEPHTFDMLELIQKSGSYDRTFQLWVFAALFIGFAIKVPVFPFHTWLPDAHVEAPTPVSVILAGILLKMGGYGLLRISYPMLPEAAHYFAYSIALLGLINIIYGAFCAMAQSDLKKLVAYSSISHMGYVLLGTAVMTQAGWDGAVLQMFNHGCVTAMLFLLVGVLYDRAHHREIDRFGGLGSNVPVIAGFWSLAGFAALGLPGLSSFISEALVFLGAFPVYRTVTILAALGIILTAGYILWMLQRIFMGQPKEQYADFPEISSREVVTLVPLGIIVIILGVYPMPVLALIRASTGYLLGLVTSS